MKTALVTGGGRGIGRAICIRLAKEGYYVIVNYVSNEAAAEETLAAIKADGGDGETMRFDVSDPAAVKESISAWQAAHPEEYIEVLVNNAGIRKDNLMIWMEDAEWQSVLDTNLCGFYNVTKQLLQPMILKKFGRIISVASLSGLKGLPGQVNYSAAKGGLIAATKALAQEVGRKNITVNAVAPGFIVSDMTNGLDEAALKKDIPVGRFGRPEEVAAVVSFLASREASYVTGECISINGGLYC
ncbi:MAG: 3-oxoacyl-ACP reductase FabG [Bacteroidales bacterium]|nr:3-oxoacyl-ACP reductase FabG [Bacteroidales bacterium]